MLKQFLIPCLLMPLPAVADMSAEADACIDELISRFGNVGGEVLDQQFSEAAIMVRLKDGNGAVYECIVWDGPEVADLRRVDGDAGTGGGATAEIVSGTQPVKFAAGTSGTSMTATLNSNTSVRYVLGASDGQFLNVDIASYGGAIDYKILNPDGSELLGLVSSETPYQGQLWQSGDHVVEVINAGAQPVTFDIGIGIN